MKLEDGVMRKWFPIFDGWKVCGALIVLGCFLIILGVFLDAELLINLGPLKKSLLHDDILVRKTTHLEIVIVKYSLVLSGVFALLIIPFRKKLLASKLVTKINNCQDQEKPFRSIESILCNYSFWIMAVLMFGVSLLYFFGDIFLSEEKRMFLFREDGVCEYSTAVLFLVASFFSLKAGRMLWPGSRNILSFLLCFGFLFCFAEEISWGQRIFQFQTPEIIENANIQKEMNFHNLLGYFSDHIFIAGTLFVGFVLPLAATFFSFLRKLCFLFGIPLASGGLAVGFLLASLYHQWTIGRISENSIIRPAEMRELFSATGFALLMFEHYLSNKKR